MRFRPTSGMRRVTKTLGRDIGHLRGSRMVTGTTVMDVCKSRRRRPRVVAACPPRNPRRDLPLGPAAVDALDRRRPGRLRGARASSAVAAAAGDGSRHSRSIDVRAARRRRPIRPRRLPADRPKHRPSPRRPRSPDVHSDGRRTAGRLPPARQPGPGSRRRRRSAAQSLERLGGRSLPPRRCGWRSNGRCKVGERLHGSTESGPAGDAVDGRGSAALHRSRTATGRPAAGSCSRRRWRC